MRLTKSLASTFAGSTRQSCLRRYSLREVRTPSLCLVFSSMDVDAVDVGAVDVGPGWGCLAGRSFLDGRRKIRRSQQQRSSNEKEIRTAARIRNKFASLQMAGLFGYSARALNKVTKERLANTTTADRKRQETRMEYGCRRLSILQAREQEEMCQRS